MKVVANVVASSVEVGVNSTYKYIYLLLVLFAAFYHQTDFDSYSCIPDFLNSTERDCSLE